MINIFNIFKSMSDCSICNKCSICMDGIKEDKNCTITQCGHKFHTECLLKWVLSNSTHSCPYCRFELVENNKKEEMEEVNNVDVDEIVNFINSEYIIEDRLEILRKRFDDSEDNFNIDDYEDNFNIDEEL